MVIKLEYNTENGQIVGFWPDFISYEKIPENTIDIDEETWIDCRNNRLTRKVDLTIKTVVACDAPQPLPNDLVKQQIAELEAQQTDRRVREATLGIDGGWLKNLNDQITALRGQLK